MILAFIGTGVMGRGMIHNLLQQEHEVHIYTRTKASAEKLIAEGAVWHDSIASAIEPAKIVLSCVGYPKDVEEIYLGNNGIIQNAKEGTILVDMTTSSPALAVHLAAAAKERNLSMLDAPVSGGDVGAQNGTLTFMVGGSRSAFDTCYRIFQAMGKNICYMGPQGSGQHTKMANQIAIAGAIAGVSEAIAYAKTVGMDAQAVVDTIKTGAAASWQLSNNGQKMLQNDMAPGFFIKHFIKDMKLAQDEANQRALSLPILKDTLDLYERLAERDLENLGTQALIKSYLK